MAVSSLFSLTSTQSYKTFLAQILKARVFIHWPGNTKGGSITVPLTSYLTSLDSSVLGIKTKIVSCLTADSKPVKQEVNCTVILPPFRLPCTGEHFNPMETQLVGQQAQVLSPRGRIQPLAKGQKAKTLRYHSVVQTTRFNCSKNVCSNETLQLTSKKCAKRFMELFLDLPHSHSTKKMK